MKDKTKKAKIILPHRYLCASGGRALGSFQEAQWSFKEEKCTKTTTRSREENHCRKDWKENHIYWYLSVVVIFCSEIRWLKYRNIKCVSVLWADPHRCTVASLSCKWSWTFGGSVVYQKHAYQNKSVLFTHTSVPGECESFTAQRSTFVQM